MKRLGFALAVLLIALVASRPADCTSTVVLVRHAEKASVPGDDPPLSAAGKNRANVLANILADSGVSAIFVTQFRRTAQTAAPLAARVLVKTQLIRAENSSDLVKTIRAIQNGVVVVVGHSNTIPEIIAALGGPSVLIPETEFDNLFVLVPSSSGTSFLRLHYGPASPGLQSRKQDGRSIMQMEFSRSGGFAGMATSVGGTVIFRDNLAEVTSSSGYHRNLSNDEAESLKKTLAQPGLRSSSSSSDLRDAYQYHVQLSYENKKSRSFVFQETVSEGNTNKLLSWVVLECQRIWDFRTNS